jgi:exonuclease VII small subunit
VTLARATARYQAAIKMLREAHGYLKAFDRDEEYLYGEDSFMLEWIKEDSNKAFREAFYDVKRVRDELEEAKKNLIDSFSKKGTKQ